MSSITDILSQVVVDFSPEIYSIANAKRHKYMRREIIISAESLVVINKMIFCLVAELFADYSTNRSTSKLFEKHSTMERRTNYEMFVLQAVNSFKIHTPEIGNVTRAKMAGLNLSVNKIEDILCMLRVSEVFSYSDEFLVFMTAFVEFAIQTLIYADTVCGESIITKSKILKAFSEGHEIKSLYSFRCIDDWIRGDFEPKILKVDITGSCVISPMSGFYTVINNEKTHFYKKKVQIEPTLTLSDGTLKVYERFYDDEISKEFIEKYGPRIMSIYHETKQRILDIENYISERDQSMDLSASIHVIHSIFARSPMFLPKTYALVDKIGKHVISKLMDEYSKTQSFMKSISKIFSNDLASHALYDVREALRKYQRYHKDNLEPITKIPRTNKAQITLDVLIVENIIKYLGFSNMSNEFVVAVAAAVEYLIKDIVIDSCALAGKGKRNNFVTPCNVYDLLKTSEDLRDLIRTSNLSRYFESFELQKVKQTNPVNCRVGAISFFSIESKRYEYVEHELNERLYEIDLENIDDKWNRFGSVYAKSVEIAIFERLNPETGHIDLEDDEEEEEEEDVEMGDPDNDFPQVKISTEEPEVFTFTKAELEQHDIQVIMKFLEKTKQMGASIVHIEA